MRTDSLPGETFRGRVAFIVPVIDEATRTAKVRLEFPNPSGQLHAGQLVTARILADPKLATNEVLAVPRSAIEQVEGKTVVFVKAGEAFERRNVLLGTSGGDRVEIRKGLAAGEMVAVDGAFLLKSELLTMSLGRIVELSVRRRGVVLAIWAAVFARRADVRYASCRSTRSPTSRTRRCRS